MDPRNKVLSEGLRLATEAFVRERMKGFDASHDFDHVDRVRKMALHLGAIEKADLRIVELAALLHDVEDHKYETPAQGFTLRDFLRDKVDAEDLEKIVDIVDNVSYSKEVARTSPMVKSKELQCVQDADRLDAIGAIGIARCLTFGAVRGIRIHGKVSAVSHFHEKLLKIKGMMVSFLKRNCRYLEHCSSWC